MRVEIYPTQLANKHNQIIREIVYRIPPRVYVCICYIFTFIWALQYEASVANSAWEKSKVIEANVLLFI